MCLAFRDIAPTAKTHFLVIPKTSYKNGLSQLSKATSSHEQILGHLMVTVAKVAKE